MQSMFIPRRELQSNKISIRVTFSQIIVVIVSSRLIRGSAYIRGSEKGALKIFKCSANISLYCTSQATIGPRSRLCESLTYIVKKSIYECRITWRGPCLRVETCSEIKVKSKTKVLNLLVDIFATSLTIYESVYEKFLLDWTVLFRCSKQYRAYPWSAVDSIQQKHHIF